MSVPEEELFNIVRSVTELPITPLQTDLIRRMTDKIGLLAPAVAYEVCDEFDKQIMPQIPDSLIDLKVPELDTPLIKGYPHVPSTILSAWSIATGDSQSMQIASELNAEDPMRQCARLFLQDRRGFELAYSEGFLVPQRRGISLPYFDRMLVLGAERYRYFYLAASQQ